MPAPPLGFTGTTTHPGDRQTAPQPSRSPVLSHSFCYLPRATRGSSRSRLRASPPRLNVAPMLFDEPKNCLGRRGIVGIEGQPVGIEGEPPVLNAERSVDIRGFFDAERSVHGGSKNGLVRRTDDGQALPFSRSCGKSVGCGHLRTRAGDAGDPQLRFLWFSRTKNGAFPEKTAEKRAWNRERTGRSRRERSKFGTP